jgi:5-methyltetrahydrofolate--homocysteine methyltransferase
VRSILERISHGEVLLCDGAMGTMLMEHGLKPGECPEEWNQSHPDVITEIARLYAKAGADIIQTNTFGGTPLRLVPYGLDSHTEDVTAGGIRAARNGSGGQTLVALSCGPTGRQLKLCGDSELHEIQASFERQIRAAFIEGIDAIIIETMTDLTEATLAIESAKTSAPGVPIVATMTFDLTPSGFMTIKGVTVAQAAAGLTAAGADLIGSNCGNGIDNMVRVASEFRKHTSLPLAIQSNAGLPRMDGDRCIYAETPIFMTARIEALLKSGVSIIGGCCGTTPEHIAAFRQEIDRLVRH